VSIDQIQAMTSSLMNSIIVTGLIVQDIEQENKLFTNESSERDSERKRRRKRKENYEPLVVSFGSFRLFLARYDHHRFLSDLILCCPMRALIAIISDDKK
jgi:hypothetical protein